MKMPKIRERKIWSSMEVRNFCVRHDFYACGDNEDYETMLDFVRQNAPTTESLYLVAYDIAAHSEDQTVTNMMFLLSKETVMTFFEIEEGTQDAHD